MLYLQYNFAVYPIAIRGRFFLPSSHSLTRKCVYFSTRKHIAGGFIFVCNGATF